MRIWASAAPIVLLAGLLAGGTGGQPSLDWRDCGGTVRCATVRVPLDWARPGGAQITLAVARRPADVPAERLGVLLFSPGTASAVDQLVRYGAGFPADLTRRFDLVAVGQRGAPTRVEPAATTLRCAAHEHDPAVGQFPGTDADFQRLVAHNRSFAASCPADLLAHLDVASQARDWDAVRAALGERQLNVLTFTNASQVARAYAALYPHRLRAMAVDSPPDWTTPAGRSVRQQAVATETGLAHFASWCTASACVPGADPVATYDAMLTHDALPAPGVDHPLTAGELATFGTYFLTNGQPPQYGGWVNLAGALTEQRQGAPAATMGGMYAATFGDPAARDYWRATVCANVRPQAAGYAALRARAAAVTALAPHTRGVTEAWDMMAGCVGWPAPAAVPPRPGTPNLLVVASRSNPFAPYPQELAFARGAAVLDWAGDGHIAYLLSPCVQAVVDAFLTTARPPATRACT